MADCRGIDLGSGAFQIKKPRIALDFEVEGVQAPGAFVVAERVGELALPVTDIAKQVVRYSVIGQGGAAAAEGVLGGGIIAQ